MMEDAELQNPLTPCGFLCPTSNADQYSNEAEIVVLWPEARTPSNSLVSKQPGSHTTIPVRSTMFHIVIFVDYVILLPFPIPYVVYFDTEILLLDYD
jgi:hypothetical protein